MIRRRAFATVFALPCLGLVLSLAVAAHPACAQEAAPPKGVTVTVFFLSSPGVSDDERVSAERYLHLALLENKRLAVKHSGYLLSEYSGEIPKADIQAAAESLQSGEQAMLDKRYAAAEKKYREATAAYESLLPYIRKEDLARAMEGLGAALASQRKNKEATEEFRQLLVWRPEDQYDTQAHGDAGWPLFARVQQQVAKLPTGSLSITTDPPGAEAFVDGRFAGVTPVVAMDLTEGDHYVTFEREGYNKGGLKAHVDSRRQEIAGLALVKNQQYQQIQSSLDQERASLGNPTADAALVDLRTTLFIDQVVVVTLDPQQDGGVMADAYLYDLRNKQRLSHVQKEIPAPGQVKTAMGDLAAQLYTGVSYDASGTVVAATSPGGIRFSAGDQEEDQEENSVGGAGKVSDHGIVTKWWFWTAVGAVVVSSVVVTVALTSSSPAPSCQAGSACTTFSW